jgi:NADPH2:quinone reductase
MATPPYRARMGAAAQGMRAIVVREFGGPEVLRLEQVPIPEIGHDELLVEVVAAGVNPVDVSNHEDGEWAHIVLPYTPGSDVSGVVRAIGADVRRFAPGDEVFALTDFLGVRNGSYAEYQAVPEAIAVRKPPSLSHVEAASVPVAAGTAYEVVVRRLDVQRDERVVIFGAAGGVGGFATQLAVQRGAQVIAVGRVASHEYLRSLGAALVLDHTAGDVIAQIAETVGEVDVSVDLVGGHTVESSLAIVREGGRLATIASLAGDLDLVIDRNLTLHGVLVRPDRARLEELAALLENGELRATVRAEHPLEDAELAHREVLRGGVPGKTVLRVR